MESVRFSSIQSHLELQACAALSCAASGCAGPANAFEWPAECEAEGKNSSYLTCRAPILHNSMPIFLLACHGVACAYKKRVARAARRDTLVHCTQDRKRFYFRKLT